MEIKIAKDLSPETEVYLASDVDVLLDILIEYKVNCLKLAEAAEKGAEATVINYLTERVRESGEVIFSWNGDQRK